MKYCLFLSLIFVLKPVYAEVVTCSAKGTFQRYQKGFMGFPKVVFNAQRGLCPGVEIPSLRPPQDGTPVQASCESGYTLTFQTQIIQKRTMVSVFLSNSSSQFKENDDREQEEKVLIGTMIVSAGQAANEQTYDASGIFSIMKSPREFEKIEKVTVKCRSSEMVKSQIALR